jgi:hypothetical protein
MLISRYQEFVSRQAMVLNQNTIFLSSSDTQEVRLVHLRYLLRYSKIDKLLSWIQKSDEKQKPIMHQLLEYLDDCKINAYNLLKIGRTYFCSYIFVVVTLW